MTDRTQVVLVCQWCGCNFDRPAAMGPPPTYCKPSHRQRAYQERRIAAAIADAVAAERKRAARAAKR